MRDTPRATDKPAPLPSSKTDETIEALRGIAIILVIGFHIASDPELGTAKAGYQHLAFSFQNVRMPLFTVISGYLYGSRPARPGQGWEFLRGKGRRILLPMAVVATLEFLATSLLPGVNNPTSLGDIWKVFVLPYEHYWFLQAMLVVFIVTTILDSRAAMRTSTQWLAVLLASWIPFLWFPAIWPLRDVFSVGGATYLFPYFLLGVGMTRFPATFRRKTVILASVAAVALGVAVEQMSWYGILNIPTAKRTLAGGIIGVAWCVTLFQLRRPLPALAVVGSFAFPIYLFQGFGSAIGRRIAEGWPPHAYFGAVVAITLAFGMVVATVAARVPVLRLALLGLRGPPSSRVTPAPDRIRPSEWAS